MSKQKQMHFRGALVRVKDGARLEVGGFADSTGARLLLRDVNAFCETLWVPFSARKWEPHEPIYGKLRPAGFVFEPDDKFFWDDVILPGVGFVRCRNRKVA